MASPDTSVVPAGRKTVWNPGIPGGVPADNSASSPATVWLPTGNPYGGYSVNPALGNNSSAAFAAINAAITSAAAVASYGARKIVFLAPGTYRCSGDFVCRSYVTLRGSVNANGQPTTIIDRYSGNASNSAFSMWGGSSTWGTPTNVTVAATKGSATITVASATGIAVGDIITIDQTSAGSEDGPSSGTGVYNADGTGNWVWWLTSLWYCRQPYSSGNGTAFLFPDSTTWRHISQKCEVLAKNGNVLTVYDAGTERGAPIHINFPLAQTPQVYRSGGSTADVLRYSGLESLKIYSFSDNGHDIISVNQAAFCWITGCETDGTKNGWGGKHVRMYGQTYRCNFSGNYHHHSNRYDQGGNAYGFVYSGSDHLIENNVMRSLNKPIFGENSSGGNVVAYNYCDEAVIGGLNSDWQEAAISTHAAFCHNDLIEGNYTPNMGVDATHGNNGWFVYFRNHAFGANSSGTSGTYQRALFVDGWQREITSIGNVLWKSGVACDYLGVPYPNGVNAVYNGPTWIYLLGSNAWTLGTGNKPGADNMDNGYSAANFYRHLDWDYKQNAQYDNPANAVKTLPDSLYRTTKPAWWGAGTWPWVNPSGATKTYSLPAKVRYDAGTPTAPPVAEAPVTVPVTYPDAVTWEATVTGLRPGLNTFTVSDGTDTVTVGVDVLEGVAAGHAGAAGTLRSGIGLAGTAGGHAGGAAIPGARVPLSGAAGGHADAAAAVIQDAHLTGAAGGHAAGAASTGAQSPLVGDAGGQAGAVGEISVAQPLTGTAAGHAGATVGLGLDEVTTGRAIRVMGSQGYSATVILPIAWDLVGDQGNAASVGVAPTGYFGPTGVEVSLAGAAAGGAGAVATGPQTAAHLEGSAGGQAGGQGTIPVDISLTGAASGQAAVAGRVRPSFDLGSPPVSVEWTFVSSVGSRRLVSSLGETTDMSSRAIVRVYQATQLEVEQWHLQP